MQIKHHRAWSLMTYGCELVMSPAEIAETLGAGLSAMRRAAAVASRTAAARTATTQRFLTARVSHLEEFF